MQTERNIGIDLLKIVSMLMIVTLHMLGHGGVLDDMPPMSRCYQVAWLIEIACYGAVNCYALASGFLTARCNIRKLMELWLQVMFYSLMITIVMDCVAWNDFKRRVDLFIFSCYIRKKLVCYSLFWNDVSDTDDTVGDGLY